MSTAGQRAQIDGPQLMIDLQDGLRRHHILAHQAHVLPGRDRGVDQKAAIAGLIDMLDHDHGVGLLRQGIAGIDRVRLPSQPKAKSLCFPRVAGIGSSDGIAVHSRAMIMRRRQFGSHRSGGDAPQRLVKRDGFAGQRS